MNKEYKAQDLLIMVGMVKAAIIYIEKDKFPRDDVILEMLKTGIGEIEDDDELMDEDLEDEVF